jgi:hypothetical protein
VVVDCGSAFVQSILDGGAMLVEARGDLAPALLGEVDHLFADYRSGGQTSSETEPGCLAVSFDPGDRRVAEAMILALDAIASTTGEPLRLADGQGSFMPKRTGFLGLGGFGPVA